MIKIIKYISYVLFTFSLVNCNSSKIDYNYPKAAEEVRENRPGSLLDGKVGKAFFNKKDSPNLSSHINHNLWRATLDIVSFMPLSSIDSNSGMIVTDWYSDPGAPTERFKANIRITGDQLSVNSVKVIMFKQIMNNQINWIDVEPNSNLARDLEDKILDRARQIKISEN